MSRRQGKYRIGSYTVCEHPERWLRWTSWTDYGEPLDEPDPRCSYCGRTFTSKAEARRERLARWAARQTP